STRHYRRLYSKEAPSRCARTNRRSDPIGAYPRASTMCPQEFGRDSTFLPIAPFRKVRVVGLACTRRRPRFFTSARGEGREKRSKFGSDSQVVLVASIRQIVHESFIRRFGVAANFVIQASRRGQRQRVRKTNYRMSTAPLFPTS